VTAETESVDLVMAVLSSSIEVVSPFSGQRCAFLHVELFENESSLVGEQILGDVVTLSTPRETVNHTVKVVVRRATFHSVLLRTDPPIRIERAIAPEVMALAAVHSKGGVLSYRERPILIGERVRLRAIVERVPGRSSSAATSVQMVVRGDLGPCRIDEVLSFPPSSSPSDRTPSAAD
jgi:hypothetical protein